MARKARGPSPFITTDSSMPIATQRSIRRLEQRVYQLGQGQHKSEEQHKSGERVVEPTVPATVGILPNANPSLPPQLIFNLNQRKK